MLSINIVFYIMQIVKTLQHFLQTEEFESFLFVLFCCFVYCRFLLGTKLIFSSSENMFVFPPFKIIFLLNIEF